MVDRQFTDEPALYQEQEDLLLAEDIVHALDASVAQSVNRALAVALQPIARQFKRYALTVLTYGQTTPGPSAPQTDIQTPHPLNWPHAAPLARLSQAMVTDHEYSAQPSTSTQGEQRLPPAHVRSAIAGRIRGGLPSPRISDDAPAHGGTVK
ncbi:hypothetical protein NDU88_000093 [Pleurodeles waltl]|uniref:Uncharacterized protein n=1 Tax=Pleurodeles waltl TaxID=8319 RepID=A0AAV7U3D0_PLEWA|nr:hypothetical protein NDU88_000093 [Pleurodeles waltl]